MIASVCIGFMSFVVYFFSILCVSCNSLARLSCVSLSWIRLWHSLHSHIKSDQSSLCFLFHLIDSVMWWTSTTHLGHSGNSQLGYWSKSLSKFLLFIQSATYFLILIPSNHKKMIPSSMSLSFYLVWICSVKFWIIVLCNHEYW